MGFSERLLELRKTQGLSQEMLAERIGVSRQAVSKWEVGEATPDLNKLLSLADVLDVSLDHLCGRQEVVNTIVKPVQKRKHNCWIIICAVLTIIAALLLLQVMNLREIENKGSMAEQIKIIGSTFYSSNGNMLRYKIIPDKISRNDTYELLITPETPIGGAPKPVKLDSVAGVFEGELAFPVSASTWTVSLRISRGGETWTVPVATEIHYNAVQNTLGWENAW
ncbi:MAG: helix-turn-helix transcriptional regulator [Ruminococcaceae bacterium]|nr:helix-turn-helix transcriptional regulator [Oscillospiraceae bacterium]